jgi:HK97 gp10 family phage protein
MTMELNSLADLAMHIVAAATEIERDHGRRALNEAAKLIKQDARAQIGHYQDEVGAYPAWAPLAESTEEEKARIGAPADAPLDREGDLKKSFRSNFEGDDSVIVGSTDPVMEYHEFGTFKMPPRPVLGPALLKNIDAIQALVGASAVDAIVSGQRLGYRFSVRDWGKALQGNADWRFSQAETGGGDADDETTD